MIVHDDKEKRRLTNFLSNTGMHLKHNQGELVVMKGSGQGPVPFVKKWNEKLVARCLIEVRKSAYTWVNMPQFRIFEGGRTLDLLSISCGEWGGNGQRIGYEIKVSKSDFRSEMRKPEKYLETMRYCDFFYYVAPPGIIDPHDLPKEAGLIEVYQDERKLWYGRWRAKVVLRAARMHPLTDADFFKALSANMSKKYFDLHNPRQGETAVRLTYDCTKSRSKEYMAALVDHVIKAEDRTKALYGRRGIPLAD